MITLENGEMIAKGSTDQNGELIFRNLDSDKNYLIFSETAQPEINISIDYYQEDVLLAKGNPSDLRPLIGMPLTNPLLYDYNSSEYQSLSEIQTKLKQILNDFPSIRLVLVGHTDQKGTPTYNQTLSLKRVQSLKNQLITSLGFNPSSIQVEAKGETQPLVDKQEIEVQENRRVELLVLGY